MQPMEVFLLMFNKVMGVFKNVKITKYIVMLMSFLAVSALLIVLSIVFSDAVLAYNVEYDGDVIAQIEDKKVFKNAKFLAEECIASDNAEELQEKYVNDSDANWERYSELEEKYEDLKKIAPVLYLGTANSDVFASAENNAKIIPEITTQEIKCGRYVMV